jgi:hypothetical protein
MLSRVFNTIRHSRRANRLFFYYLFIIRLCRFCISRNLLYIIFNLSEHCEQYFRNKRFYELTLPNAEMERLLRQKRELFDKIIKVKTKITRFIKQHRLII